jgi:tetratricopeptide (TPR) repeat protein
MACLDERLAEVEALVGLFGTADAKLVQGSVGAAQKLSRISDCADLPSLLAPDPLPKDPMARIEAASLHKQLATARAIYKSSRLGDTLALLNKIAPEVTRLNHLPTTAELHLLTGQTLWVMQGNAIGEPELLQAVWAAEAGKADSIKMEAWLQLTNLANEASHFDVAAERLHDASAALARIGTNWNFKVRILDAEALLDSRLNLYDKAIAVAAQAREVADKHTEADSQSYALLVEASILTSAGRAQDAVADFKKVLAFQDALGHHRIEVAVTLQSLAGAEMVTGHIDDAIPHLQDALAIAKGIYGETNSEIARIYSAIGVAQVGKGDLAAGLATHQKALAIAERTVGKDDEVYALMSGQVGYTLVSMQKSKQAMPYLDRALEIETKKLGPANVQVLSLMLTKCDILHADNAMKAAVELCKRTLALGEKSLGKDSPLLFLFLAHTGDTLVDAKQPKQASALLERAEKLGATNPADNFAVVLLDAHAVWDLGDHKRAIALAQKARAGFTQLAQADQAREADDWLNKHH